jgi:hypothetical protein
MGSIEQSGSEKPETDWTVIEREYRLGVRAVTAIATDNGVSEGAVRKRAKRDAWTRDLNAKVRAKADELVRKAAVRAEVRIGQKATEAKEVEILANTQMKVRLAQRVDIQDTRALVKQLMGELQQQTSAPELFEQVEDLLATREDGTPLSNRDRSKLQDAHQKALSLGGRTATLKSLVEALRVLIALEREAFGIDGRGEDGEEGDKTFLEMLLHARARVSR